jgi:sorbitol/mannitol transport system permease protein
MPHLYRFMQLGALLGAVYVVQEVDAIFMTTQGGPGTLTTNLPYYVYETAIRGSQLGRGAAIGVVVVALTIVAMTGLFRVLDRMLRGFYD